MNLGKISYWIGRAGVQANKIIVPANFLMLIYLTTRENPLWLLLLPFGVAGFALFMYFDHKKVIEGELGYWFDRNPRFQAMQNDLEEIKLALRKQAY